MSRRNKSIIVILLAIIVILTIQFCHYIWLAFTYDRKITHVETRMDAVETRLDGIEVRVNKIEKEL